jgi:hypothetical protein
MFLSCNVKNNSGIPLSQIRYLEIKLNRENGKKEKGGSCKFEVYKESQGVLLILFFLIVLEKTTK